MTALLPNVDPDGLLEFSVVFTDRSLNHMSTDFQSVMCDISKMLTSVYNTNTCAIVPGGGTFAMESVAREFATDKKVMVLRNGWFSFRWSQIFETGDIPSEVVILKAKREGDHTQSAFRPQPIEDVVESIITEKPAVFFAPHVETSSGIILIAVDNIETSTGRSTVNSCGDRSHGCVIDVDTIGVSSEVCRASEDQISTCL